MKKAYNFLLINWLRVRVPPESQTEVVKKRGCPQYPRFLTLVNRNICSERRVCRRLIDTWNALAVLADVNGCAQRRGASLSAAPQGSDARPCPLTGGEAPTRTARPFRIPLNVGAL